MDSRTDWFLAFRPPRPLAAVFTGNPHIDAVMRKKTVSPNGKPEHAARPGSTQDHRAAPASDAAGSTFGSDDGGEFSLSRDVCSRG